MKLSTLQRKKFRVRNKLKGNSKNDRFRLSVSRSLKNISAQIIDDAKGETLVAASTLDADFKKAGKTGADVSAATAIGKAVGELALKKGLKLVVFDRGGFRYHGRVKALADAAREAGLEF